MAEQGPYLGNSMTLSMEREDATSIPIGRITGVEIRMKANEIEYFTADQTTRDDVSHTQRVPVVSGTIGSWDVLMAKSWLGGSGTNSTGLVDTSDPQKFKITGSVLPKGGSSRLEAEVIGATFPTMPIFSASLDEYIGLEIEGRGDDLNITSEPS